MNQKIGDFNAKVDMENIFKPTIGNESLHKSINANTVLELTISKNFIVKSTMFPKRNIHKFNSTFPDGKTYKQIYHI
jgi:hypothetical protein